MKEMKNKIFTIPIMICLTFGMTSCSTIQPTHYDLAMQLAEIKLKTLLRNEAILFDPELKGHNRELAQFILKESQLKEKFAQFYQKQYTESELKHLLAIYDDPVFKKYRAKENVFPEAFAIFRVYCQQWVIKQKKQQKDGQHPLSPGE